MSKPSEHEHEYVHGTEASEQERLEVQAKMLGGGEFLPPLRPGMRILDVGCGTGAIAREVAVRIAPGEVVGVDREEVMLDTAQGLARAEGIENVLFVRGDANKLDFGDNEFDAAYARFLLEHVASPPDVVREIVRVVKPGGWVCVYEWENACDACYPESPAIAEVWRGIFRLQQILNTDPWVARKLYGIFLRAGLIDVQTEGRAWTANAGEQDKLQMMVDGALEITHQTRAGLLVERLVPEDVIDRAEQEYQRLLDDPAAFIMAGFTRAIGTKF
jgi:ubiquinone/menaquinone biosynthesis C-methylase UbiE